MPRLPLVVELRAMAEKVGLLNGKLPKRISPYDFQQMTWHFDPPRDEKGLPTGPDEP
ncbi:unnamed protein product, partial [Heterosigma akashiwo]